MRLYLCSDGLGDKGGALAALLSGGDRAMVLRAGRDAGDGIADSNLTRLGLATETLPLEAYFGRPAALREALSGADLVWAEGDNSFVLRRAMQQSGFDELIVELLADDAVVYCGADAGAAVAGPSLRGLHLMDDPNEVPAGYESGVVWDGLGLIDHVVVPHYRSAHPRSAGADRTLRDLCARGRRYRALRDGEAMVWVEERRPVPAGGSAAW